MEALTAAGEWQKALQRAVSKTPLCDDVGRLGEIRSKFPGPPAQEPPAPAPVPGVVNRALPFWSDLAEQFEKTVRKLPRRSGPGMDGSRFEHWSWPHADPQYIGALRLTVEQYLSGTAPADAYHATRQTRMVVLQKPGGGVRCLALGSAFRRLALKAANAVVVKAASAALGSEQYAIGQPSAVERMTHCVRQEAQRGDDVVVIALDLENAFGTVSRHTMLKETLSALPALEPLLSTLYSAPGTLHWQPAQGASAPVRAASGIDQGCPLSPMLFSFGLRAVLRDARSRLLSAGIPAAAVSFRAYMDDLYVVCPAEVGTAAMQAVEWAAAQANLRLNAKKTQVWCAAGRGDLPAALAPYSVLALPMLGHTLERDPELFRPPVLGDTAGGWHAMSVKVGTHFEKLLALRREGGLPAHLTQHLLRLVATTVPQHLLRGSWVPDSMTAAFDTATLAAWTELLSPPTPLTPAQVQQLWLPTKLGGFSAGSSQLRADAAFYTGCMAALDEVQTALGASTAAELEQRAPSFTAPLRAVSAKLQAKGVDGDLGAWAVDRPWPAKGLQKRLTQQVAEQMQQQVLTNASRRQAVAIRSAASSEGSLWLSQPPEGALVLADRHFQLAACRRLAAGCAHAAQTCANRGGDGARCNAPIDAEGQHACVCERGGGVTRRHDALRDKLAARLAQDLGVAVHKEQVLPELDFTDAQGILHPGRMDLVVALPGAAPALLDLTVVSPWSANGPLEVAAASRDGAAAERAEDRKRRRYPGGRVVPMVLETGGRWGPAALAWLRAAYKGESELLHGLLTECSAVLQAHTSALQAAALSS